MAEMEKLLISGGAFGGKGLGDTFKKINNQLAQEELADDENQNQNSVYQRSGDGDEVNESDFDGNIHDNSKLMMESPGQNTFVQNQINMLTGQNQHVVHHYDDAQQIGDGQSDSNLDIDGLTESQLIAL